MKKILGVFIILIVTTCLVACGKNEVAVKVENEENDKNVTGKYFDKKELNTYSKTQVIKLPEDSNTEYEWVYVIDNAEVINFIKDEYQEDGENAGFRICEIEGISEGDTIIYFDYIAGLEDNEVPAKRVKFYVSVNSNNEVAITDEIH